MHTLKDIKNRGAVGGLLDKQIPPGRWLGSIRELELEKALRSSIKTASDIANDYKDLQDKEATLAQKASSLDKIKILSFEAKISKLEEELGKQEDLKLPDWIDESLKSFVYTLGLKNKVKEIEKKIAKKDLLEVLQKALSERNSLIQEAKLKEPTNACLAKQIQKTSSEYEVHEGTRSCLSASDQNKPSSVSKLEKDNDITSPELIRPQTMTWPFSMLVTGRSGLSKTNLLANLVLGDKNEYVQRRKKGGSRYIKCDDLIVCGYHPDEPKWA
ncbi:hypothetical protein GLOIN_2v1790954 [Rhizophagus clarus]|uniref:Uncharacterized protein n=1 Tax=Rhizophagus clarus TaxID=94130 RepID=A0A8H3QH30_9GLOM|nr:hypothetical protein GLOIN_2v1790954 [Rhizophagus clarus]